MENVLVCSYRLVDSNSMYVVSELYSLPEAMIKQHCIRQKIKCHSLINITSHIFMHASVLM